MPTLRIKDMPPTERPREKFALHGPGSLSDAELLAIFFGSGSKGVNAIELGRKLIEEHETLRGIARCNLQQLMKTTGVGPAKATQLAAAFELGNRLASEKISRTKLDNPESVYDLLGQPMGSLNYESLRVLLLNTRYHLIRAEEVSHGSLNESVAHPREILLPAIVHSAFALILVHNHPSGDPSPSKADRDLTRRLASLCQELQVQLVDHIIIGLPEAGREPYFSFREMGLL